MFHEFPLGVDSRTENVIFTHYLALASDNFALFRPTLQGATPTYDTFLKSAHLALHYKAWKG